uniref:phosphatidylinositol-3,4-bisphosphate 4-phosphatase n=1 Tax=Periophthalmus magnuspinnatus TaxID=409849 RepID=A0A3B3ZH71_9GOBI
ECSNALDIFPFSPPWSLMFSLLFSAACQDLSPSGRDRKPNAFVQVAVMDPHRQELLSQACTELVEANKDPLFLTGVTFPSEYPTNPETLVKLTVYDAKDKSQESVSKHLFPIHCVDFSFLGTATFSIGDLLRAKDERLTLSLRSSDGECAAGTVVVSRLKMGEMEEVDVDHITTDISTQKVTEPKQSSLDAFNKPLFLLFVCLVLVFKNPVCKVYRFQTTDSKWMLVREQMEECTLSLSIPKQLISLYIQEDMARVQDLKELGELSPHWDNLRKEVMNRYGGIISSYQETLTEMDKITGSFKPSCCKAQKSLEFIPINLHTQRMRVTCPRKTGSTCWQWFTYIQRHQIIRAYNSNYLLKIHFKSFPTSQSFSTLTLTYTHIMLKRIMMLNKL